MPLYEYKCRSCGKTFEVIQKFADEPLTTHGECGGIVDKLFSAPAFHLKGTGWYATDYGKGNGKSEKSDDSKSESKSEKADKAESKPKTESTSSTSDSKTSRDSKTSSESKTESKPTAPSESKPSPAA
jgi:putative FmdB family regulatory protein